MPIRKKIPLFWVYSYVVLSNKKESGAIQVKNERALKTVLFVAGCFLVLVGISCLIDIQRSLASAGIVILTVTEANELTAIYGGLFIVLGSLCLFARERPHDAQLIDFIALAFLFVAAMRLYAAVRHGMPELSRIHVSFIVEVFFGVAIIAINAKLKKERA